MESRKPRGCCLLLLGAAELLLVVLDTVVGGFESLVLHEHALHQRIDRIRRPAQALADHRFGVGIARIVLQRRKALKQLIDKLAFLRGHGVLPGTVAGSIWGVP